MIITSKIPSNFSGYNIVDYLSERFTYLSRDEWILRIKEGRVSIGQKFLSVKDMVSNGEILSYDMPDFKEPHADLNYSIVYEDEYILGVNKTGNLLVHHSGKSFKSNLIYQLRHVHEPIFPNANIINRLDRETSGIVLVAKTNRYLSEMNRMFVENRVKKYYYAIVSGTPKSLKGRIALPIGRSKSSSISYKFEVNGNSAKECVTEYEVVSELKNGLSLLKVSPKTGRTHQIRVHLASIGCPIYADKLYTLSEAEFLAWRQGKSSTDGIWDIARQALHCYSVEFNHPFNNEKLSISAYVPKDMRRLIEA